MGTYEYINLFFCLFHLSLVQEDWSRDYIGRITRCCETVALHAGAGNPITGNLSAQLQQLICSRIAAE